MEEVGKVHGAADRLAYDQLLGALGRYSLVTWGMAAITARTALVTLTVIE